LFYAKVRIQNETLFDDFSYFCSLKFSKLKTVYITRKEHFNAAHKLWRSDWTDEKNSEVFGKCSNKNWHGHNYDLFVTVKGVPSPETGFVINLKDLSVLLKKLVIDELDHKNLNLDVTFMKDKLTSTENLVIEIWDIIEEPVRAIGGELCHIKLYETENNFVDYYGGKQPY
jgi:6-pyruvoyltetrahydropterin/6-carboxytetrahydropterin synthase